MSDIRYVRLSPWAAIAHGVMVGILLAILLALGHIAGILQQIAEALQ